MGALGHSAPQLVLALELAVAGVQLLCLGLVADIVARTYFSSQQQTVYRIRDIVSRAAGGSVPADRWSSNGGRKWQSTEIDSEV